MQKKISNRKTAKNRFQALVLQQLQPAASILNTFHFLTPFVLTFKTLVLSPDHHMNGTS